MREALRVRHYRYHTEQSYLDWARQYILFHGKRHPAGVDAAEVGAFLTKTRRRLVTCNTFIHAIASA